MSGAAARYEERGGRTQQFHASSGLYRTSGEGHNQQPYHNPTTSNPSTSSATSTIEHDFRFPRRPSRNTTAAHNPPPLFNASTPRTTDRMDTQPAPSPRKDMLRESFFDSWKDDAAGEELDDPDEMQKKDPLATQIWRLYTKTKKQLPNQERMENLTWRMMAMSLRRRQQEEEAARCVEAGRLHVVSIF